MLQSKNFLVFAIIVLSSLAFFLGTLYERGWPSLGQKITIENKSSGSSIKFKDLKKCNEFETKLTGWGVGRLIIKFVDDEQPEGQLRIPYDVAVASSYSFTKTSSTGILTLQFNHNKLKAIGAEKEVRLLNRQVVEAITKHSVGIKKEELNIIDTSPIENVTYLVFNDN